MILFYALVLSIVTRYYFKSWTNPVILAYLMVSFQLVLGQIIRSLGYAVEFNSKLDLIYLIYGCFLILGFIITSVFFKGRIIGRSWGLLTSYNASGLTLLNSVVLSLGIVTLLLLVRAEVFSLFDIRRYYIESRQDGGFGALIFLIGLFGPIIFVANLSVNKRGWALIIFIAMLLTGKKAPLFTSMLLFIVFLFDGNRLNKWTLIYIMSGSVGLVLLQVSTSTSSLSPVKILSGYFAYYNYASYVVDSASLFSDYYDLFEINLSRLWKLIPRMIYPEKPFLYGYNLVHSVVFPQEYRLGFTPGISSKITVPYFESGFLGVILYGLINGVYTGLVTVVSVVNKNIVIKYLCLKLIITGFSLYSVLTFAVIIFISKINVRKSYN